MDFKPLSFECTLSIKKIVTIHYFEYTRDFAFKGEKHDFWEMVYIDKGEVGVMADNKGYILKQGEAIFHKPFEYHNIWANKTYANVVIISFVPHGDAIMFFKNKLLKLDELDKEILSKIISDANQYFEEPLNIVNLKRMTWKNNTPWWATQLLKLHIEELLINLIKKEQLASTIEHISHNTTIRNEEKIVGDIKKYLAENITKPITLDDICSKFCFSKTYIKTLFKSMTGKSVMQYFISIKLGLARRYISEENLTFSEIALKCGFSSVHYFSKTFKKHTLMTPTEYSLSIKSKRIL